MIHAALTVLVAFAQETLFTPDAVRHDPQEKDAIQTLLKHGMELRLNVKGRTRQVFFKANGRPPQDALRALESFALLESVGFIGAEVEDDDLRFVAKIRKLRWLDLSRTKVGDAGLHHLTGMKNLFHLELKGTAVTNAGMQILGKLEGLTHLDLSGTAVADWGIASLGGLRKLATLGLDGTKVTDLALTILLDFRMDASLRALHLADTGITDAGAKMLARMNRLQVLNLRGTKITEAGKAEIKARLPRLQSMN